MLTNSPCSHALEQEKEKSLIIVRRRADCKKVGVLGNPMEKSDCAFKITKREKKNRKKKIVSKDYMPISRESGINIGSAAANPALLWYICASSILRAILYNTSRQDR